MDDRPHMHEHTAPMNCRECNNFIADYLDGALPADVSSEFERHLKRCRKCNLYLDQYRQATELVREAGEAVDDAPAELIEHTIEFLRRMRAGRM